MKATKTFTNNELSGSYSDQLGSLNDKISNIKRLLSYYDVFNITEVVENPQEFAIKLNALTPNSSLVINADPFEYAGVIYSRGDFILKDINENISHIEAKAGGVYTPILKADENVFEAAVNYCDGYKNFLNAGKTERESCEFTEKLIKDYGYTEYHFGDKLKAGLETSLAHAI